MEVWSPVRPASAACQTAVAAAGLPGEAVPPVHPSARRVYRPGVRHARRPRIPRTINPTILTTRPARRRAVLPARAR